MFLKIPEISNVLHSELSSFGLHLHSGFSHLHPQKKGTVQILNFSLPCPLAPPSGQTLYCRSINGSDSEVCGLFVVVAAVYTIT